MKEIDDITVHQFAQWWLENRPIAPPPNSLMRLGKISGICLFRAGPFQVEMFLCEPEATAPRHGHPNIDSVEVLLTGEIDFDSDRKAVDQRGVLHIEPGESHVATAGACGGAFLSIQKWLNGMTPTTVTDDWTGDPIEERHRPKITY